MPYTGDSCPTSGIYQGSCGYQIALSRGERFPPCPHCHTAVRWTLVQATQH